MIFFQTEIFKLKNKYDLVLEKEDIFLISPDEYFCRTVFTAISPGTETAAYSGLEPLRPGNIFPRLLGYCNVAEVIIKGEQVNDLSIGDHIITFQSHCSGFKQNNKDFKLVIPKNIELTHAVTAYLFHLGLHATHTGDLRAGHYVAIIGMGTLGLTTSLICELGNAQTNVFTNIPLNSFKPKDRINYLPKKLPSKQELERMTNSIGFDIIINTSNRWDDWKLAMELCRKGGVIVNLGFPGRGENLPSFNPLDPIYIYYNNIQIKPLGYIAAEDVLPFEFRFNIKRNMEYILFNMQLGRLNPEMIISDIISYTELEERYKKYLEKSETLFTTILDWRNSNL